MLTQFSRTESLHILAERLSQSEIELPLRKICYYSPLVEVGVSTQTEMNFISFSVPASLPIPAALVIMKKTVPRE